MGLERTKRGVNHNLHRDLRRRVDGVVGVGLVTRVHAAVEGSAGGVESGLGSRVVLAEEAEDDSVANRGAYLLRVEGETLRTTNSDTVGSAASTDGARGRGDNRSRASPIRYDSGRGRGTGGAANRLGDGDGLSLTNDSGCRAATDVNPEEVD